VLPGTAKGTALSRVGRENEPVIRVRQGTVNIRGLKIFHYCEGTDIWNGNAAVQVQSAFGRNGRPLCVESLSITPTANLSDCDIMSLSGRGVVVIDGAISSIHNCNVHTCAATGIYVGGSGSLANMTEKRRNRKWNRPHPNSDIQQQTSQGSRMRSLGRVP
jgi:hypothetical protein